MERLIKVKLTTGEKDNKIFRQTKNGKGISNDGKYQFLLTDDIKEADFWVVRNKYIKRPTTCNVASQNTILMLSEPSSVVLFPKSYLKQFGLVCSCQEDMKHKNVIYTHAILPWFIGQNDKGMIQHEDFINYDNLKQSDFPQKTKLISVITSNKAFSKGHLDRINFCKKLKNHFGNKIDIFGRGFNNFDDKWDVLAPYKYHIAIENSSSKYYWTEKLSDCYLSGTFPFYYGCSNINDYFPDNSYKKIDITNFDESVQIIEEAISNDLYEKCKDDLVLSKNLVLDDYNIFNEIAKCCDKLDPNASKSKTTLSPPTKIDSNHFYNHLIKRTLFKIKYSLFHKNKNQIFTSF